MSTSGQRRLAARAKCLGMWPNRRDEPPYPWTIWPEWTFAIWMDPLGRSEHSDSECQRYRTRVRLGIVLVVVEFGGFTLITMLSES